MSEPGKRMGYRFISRRRFIGSSIAGGLAVSLGVGAEPPRAAVSGTASGADGLTLEVTGDAQNGYGVGFLFNGKPILRHNLGGEFSAVLQNEERSLEDRVDNWKATSWGGDAKHVTLRGECKLKNLNTTVFVNVDYERITPRLVRKKIRLRQADMFLLFYQISNRLEAQERPARLWSFNELDWQGGTLHEYFPAAGFRMKKWSLRRPTDRLRLPQSMDANRSPGWKAGETCAAAYSRCQPLFRCVSRGASGRKFLCAADLR
jgi:hypothetical protein